MKMYTPDELLGVSRLFPCEDYNLYSWRRIHFDFDGDTESDLADTF